MQSVLLQLNFQSYAYCENFGTLLARFEVVVVGEVGLVDVGNFGKLLAQFVVGVGLFGMV